MTAFVDTKPLTEILKTILKDNDAHSRFILLNSFNTIIPVGHILHSVSNSIEQKSLIEFNGVQPSNKIELTKTISARTKLNSSIFKLNGTKENFRLKNQTKWN